MRSLRWLSREQRVDVFPPASEALTEPNGLLAAGGDLTPERLLAAYKQGIFPWYQDGQPILWWSPDPRAVLWLDGLKVSRSLRRSVRRRGFEFRVDSAFDEVVSNAKVWETLPNSRIKGSVQLAHRIETAERLGMIEAETARLARAIKDAGNNAIHSVPGPELAPLDAVRGTVNVLKRLL